MILSTHRSGQADHAQSRASFWSIALIIIISALLAVFVEPLFPNPALAAHGNHQAIATPAAVDNQ